VEEQRRESLAHHHVSPFCHILKAMNRREFC
jgi:hypothetical protein